MRLGHEEYYVNICSSRQKPFFLPHSSDTRRRLPTSHITTGTTLRFPLWRSAKVFTADDRWGCSSGVWKYSKRPIGNWVFPMVVFESTTAAIKYHWAFTLKYRDRNNFLIVFLRCATVQFRLWCNIRYLTSIALWEYVNSIRKESSSVVMLEVIFTYSVYGNRVLPIRGVTNQQFYFMMILPVAE